MQTDLQQAAKRHRIIVQALTLCSISMNLANGVIQMLSMALFAHVLHTKDPDELSVWGFLAVIYLPVTLAWLLVIAGLWLSSTVSASTVLIKSVFGRISRKSRRQISIVPLDVALLLVSLIQVAPVIILIPPASVDNALKASFIMLAINITTLPVFVYPLLRAPRNS